MWLIKYQDEFLDVIPDEAAELEKDSPLFSAEKIPSEKSTPITIPYTNKNSRLLGHYFFEPTYRTRRKIDIQLFYNERILLFFITKEKKLRKIYHNLMFRHPFYCLNLGV